jgi:hypothetical protein
MTAREPFEYDAAPAASVEVIALLLITLSSPVIAPPPAAHGSRH